MSERDTEWSIEDIDRQVDEKFVEDFDESILSKSPFEWGLYLLALVFFGYHVYYGYVTPTTRVEHAIVHLAMILCGWGLLGMIGADRSTVQGKLKTVGYAVYSVLAVVPLYHFYSNYLEIIARAGAYNDTDVQLGGLLIFLLLFALWHTSKIIFGVAILGLIYSYFGPYLPGILAHRGLGPRRIITMNTAEYWGVFGTVLQVGATWVAIFVILAGFIEMYGGMAAFIRSVTKFAARSKYLQVGQIAVFASMVFGSLNGAATANVATTGSFTIPLMKENGYPPRLAAAIEAVASSGGQLLPPVMGAGAFIMAELIAPNYAQIVVAAALPAVLFYLSIATSIYLFTNKLNIESVNLKEGEDDGVSRSYRYFGGGKALLQNFEFIAMLLILLYWLLIVQADPMFAGAISIATLVALRFVRLIAINLRNQESLKHDLIKYARATLEGSRKALEVTINITIMLAALGIIIRAFVVTGFAQNLSRYLVLLSGGNAILLVILAAVTCILFGLGLPTVAAYLLVALFVAPSVIEALGADVLGVHLFVFYFAIASGITPPIAVAVIVAQGIAESSFTEAAIDSIRVGYPIFLLPFVFVFSPEILYPGVEMALFGVFIFIAFTAMSVGMIGTRSTTYLSRIAFVAFALLIMFFPSFEIRAVLSAIVVIGLIMAINHISLKQMSATVSDRL